MGQMDVKPQFAFAGGPGTDLPAARREDFEALYGALGAGPTGAWSRSQ
jgi:hypothetical protein